MLVIDREECRNNTRKFSNSKHRKFWSLAAAEGFAGVPFQIAKIDRPRMPRDIVYCAGVCSRDDRSRLVAGIGAWWFDGDDRYAICLSTKIVISRMISRNMSERCPGWQTKDRADLVVRIQRNLGRVLPLISRVFASLSYESSKFLLLVLTCWLSRRLLATQ